MKKERATLVRFMRWASMRGRGFLAPMEVPNLPKKAKGTRALDGRDKTHVTRAEVLAILHRLPERSRAGHPVKAFATLAAELGIRRETMDKLEVPKHYEPGAESVSEATQNMEESYENRLRAALISQRVS